MPLDITIPVRKRQQQEGPDIQLKEKPELPKPVSFEKFANSKIVKAISKKETGGEADPNIAIGDVGKARGSLQIWESYYKDAMQQNEKENLFPELQNISYEKATANPVLSKKLMYLYMRKYTPESLIFIDSIDSMEKIAKTHNGGPDALTTKKQSKINNLNTYFNGVLSILKDIK